MSENLHTCPTCGTTGFTSRGLKSHRCKGHNRNPETPKTRNTETLTSESPQWDSARFYLRAVRDSARRYIVAQICLGWQLSILKKDLGFEHGGDRRSRSQTGNLKSAEGSPATWQKWVETELGISKSTAHRFIQVYDGFQERVSKQILNRAGALESKARKPEFSEPENVLQALAAPPSELSGKQREKLETAIAKASDGLTQGQLLAELKMARSNESPDIGGDTSEHDKKDDGEDDAGQLAFFFFEGLARSLRKRVEEPEEHKTYLYALPVSSDDPSEVTLSALEHELDCQLRDVREAKKTKLSAPL